MKNFQKFIYFQKRFFRNGAKKPDMAIYVPRHRRNESPRREENSSNEKSLKSTKKEEKQNKSNAVKLKENDKSMQSNHLNNVKDIQNCTLSSDFSIIDNENLSFLKLSLDEKCCSSNRLEHCANIIAERLSEEVIAKSLESLRTRKMKIELRNRSPNYQKMLLDRILPEIATNFVNLAIENAMQLMKTINVYDKKKTIVHKLDSSKLESISSNKEITNTKTLKDGKIMDEKILPIPSDLPHETRTDHTQKKQSVSKDTVKTKSKDVKKSKSKKVKKSKKSTTHHKDTKNEQNVTGNCIATSSNIENSSSQMVDDTSADNADNVDDDWDSKWTDDGECLSEEMKKEVFLHFKHYYLNPLGASNYM